MSDQISQLERWYAGRCNGEWEHAFGVSIETLDNPGWIVKFDLSGTKAETKTQDEVKIERAENDWIFYRAAEKQFRVACGPLNLSEAIQIFLDWFNQQA